MKILKKKKKLLFSAIALLLITGLTSLSSASGENLQKTFTWNYKISSDARMEIKNYDCDLVIHTWDKDETEYHLTIDAETKTDNDAEVLKNYIRDLTFSHSVTNVSFDNRFWESRNSILGLITMKLKGNKTINLTAFDMKGELWIPNGCRFTLGSKYSQINMEDFSGSATIDLYNDNFYGGNIEGDAEITDKYSTIELKNLKGIRADLYNSRFDAISCGNLNIQSKYSKVTFNTSGDLEINSYNDKYSFSKTGDIIFVAKYSDLTTGLSGRASLNCYDGSVTMKQAKEVKMESKYADFRFDVTGDCTISSSYNDRLTAGKINSLDINESKYSTYKIDELATFLSESDGYNDKFNILKMGKEFKEIKVNGKYLELSVVIPETASYRFKANITYPNLDINESAFKPIVRIQKSSQIEYDAVKGTEKEGMPLIEANGYQLSLKIREY
jgi:hypothetical protein